MIEEPVLLVGAEQSGTTLLRLMLDSHPEVSFAEEFDYAIDVISADGEFPSTVELGARLALDRSFSTSGFEFDPSLDFPELVNGFLASRQRRSQALVVGATVHHGFSRALHLWPRVRLLHLVRDPRDVAAARIAIGLAGNPWHAVEHWIRAEDEWAAVEPLVAPDRRLTVRFGDLVRDHHSTLTTICRFLGVDYTGQMLSYVNDTDYQEPNPMLAGDWRDTLSSQDVRLVEARVGDRLVRAGFPVSGQDRLDPSDRQLNWLRWHDRAGRIAGRVQRFGVRLTAADLAARAIRSQPLKRSVQLRVNRAEMELRKKSWSDAKYRTSR
ncbi:MAG: sulfotransferase [Actinomycetota bacterium]